MEIIKNLFKAISNFITNITKPIRVAKWYQALPRFVRFIFWIYVVGLPFAFQTIGYDVMLLSIVVFGYVKAHGADKAKADAKAAADKVLTKVKEMSK